VRKWLWHTRLNTVGRMGTSLAAAVLLLLLLLLSLLLLLPLLVVLLLELLLELLRLLLLLLLVGACRLSGTVPSVRVANLCVTIGGTKGCVYSYQAALGREHACPACLSRRLRRHCRRSILVRVEELLWDFERAELIPSEDFVVLQSRETQVQSGSVW